MNTRRSAFVAALALLAAGGLPAARRRKREVPGCREARGCGQGGQGTRQHGFRAEHHAASGTGQNDHQYARRH